MPTSSMNTVMLHLRQAMCLQDEAGLTDAHLLQQFIDHRDESAFATLVRRHGSMVMGVCLRVVRTHQDAEDAFQATFLVLVRKAASISSRELLANWLYGVAYHTALKARALKLKRQAKEKQVTTMPDPATEVQHTWNDDLQALLDQEISRLPEKYRGPIILCDLDGKTRKEAAEQLGCPEGSLSSRLSRARGMLAKRLARHGLAVSGGSLAAILSQSLASATVPASVASATIKAATLYVAGQAATGLISDNVVALTQGVLKTMLMSKLKIGTICLALGLLTIGAGFLIYQTAAAHQNASQQSNANTPKETNNDRTHPDDEMKKDANALQGKWSCLSLILDGEEAPAEIVKGVVVQFKADKMTFQPGISIDATEKGKIKFHLDPDPGEMRFKLRQGSNPKEIHFTTMEPGQKERTVIAIYKFSGDTLTMCGGEPNEPVPLEFTGKKGSKQVLWVLKPLPQKGDKQEGKGPKQETPIDEAAAGAKEQEQLQGTWRLVQCTSDGVDAPGDVVKQIQIDFHGDKMRFTPALEFHEKTVDGQKQKHVEVRVGEGDFEVSFQLMPDRKPSGIDLTLPTISDKGTDKGPLVNGIYLLKGDRLTICIRNGDRPTDFTSKVGNKQALYVMERMKPIIEPSGK